MMNPSPAATDADHPPAADLPYIPPSFQAEDVAGHRIEIITSGDERLRRLLELLETATNSIDIIMYIFRDDAAGSQVVAALQSAAQRGVRVRAILDRFGSSGLSSATIQQMRTAGLETCFFSRKWRSSYLIRNHQKLILIDQKTVMTGGFNIEDGYLSDRAVDRWLDLGFVITGPSIVRIRKWCDRLYHYTVHDDGEILKMRRLIRRWTVSKGPISWLMGGPTERLSPWTQMLRKDFRHAKRIDMAMAYFSPGQGPLRRLGSLAKRGHARLILSGKSDNPATIGASRLLYGYLLKRNAKISEFSLCPFHMKLIVIDDISYIGSANFDVRSLFLNVEVMMRVADKSFAAQMRQLIDDVEAQSTPITTDLHKQRAGFLTRIRWFFSYLIVGVMDYTVARRLNFGLDKKPYRGRR